MTEKSFIEKGKDTVKYIENQIKEDFKQYCISGNLLKVEKEFNNQKIRNIILNENNIDYYTQILEESLKHGLGLTNKLIPTKNIMNDNDKIILNLIKYLCKNGKCDLIRELIKNGTVKSVLEDKENSYDLAVIIDSAYNSSGKEFVEELFDNLDLNICKILKHNCQHLYRENICKDLIDLIVNDENKIKKIKEEIKETKNLEEDYDDKGRIIRKHETKNTLRDLQDIILYACKYEYKNIIENILLKDEEIKNELFNFDNGIVISNIVYFIYTNSFKESKIDSKYMAEILLNEEEINEEITAENATEILLSNEKIKQKMTANELSMIFKYAIYKNQNIAEMVLDIFYNRKNEKNFLKDIDEDNFVKKFGFICNDINKISMINKIIKNDQLFKIIYKNPYFECIISSAFFLNCINNKKENNDFLLAVNEIKEKISTDEISKFFIQEFEKENNKEIVINLLNNKEITERLNQKTLTTCFIELCGRGENEIFEILINNEGLFEKIKNSGCFQRGFLVACENNKLELIKLLINKKEIIEEIQNEVINLRFSEACRKNNLDIIKEFLGNENLKNIISINNKDLQNLFFNIITKEEKLNQKEIELSLLLLKNDIKIENEIDNNTYKKIIKNNIKDLVKRFGINKENFEDIKSNEGYKKFILVKEISGDYKQDWDSNSPSQKMLLSLIKIKDELKNQQSTYKTI